MAEVDNFDPDAYLASVTADGNVPETPDSTLGGGQMAGMSPSFSQEEMSTFDPDAYLKEAKEEKYGTLGQKAITAVEGLAEGVAGPLATGAEKLLGVDEEDMLARREVNPVTHGVSQGVGLVGGLLTGVGEGALVAKAGQAVAKGAGLAKATSTLGKVGSAAIKEAVEGAILAGSDEVSKRILNDPNQSAETALMNMGLGAAIGGGAGGLFAGAHPVWAATAGPRVQKTLDTLKGHFNGEFRPQLSEGLVSTAAKLGVEPPPLLKAAMTGDESAVKMFNTLNYAQNPEVKTAISQFHKDVSDKVMERMGVNVDDIRVYSKNEAGSNLLSAFERELTEKYAPIAAKMKERNALASTISVPDDAKLVKYEQMLGDGIKRWGTDSPVYKYYDDWGNRILAKNTVGELDSLKTEIAGEMKKAFRSGDDNSYQALKDIRNSISDLQESQILSQAERLGQEGAEYGAAIGRDIVAERQAANEAYKGFAKLSDDISDHLGLGGFSGTGRLISKVEGVTPELLLRKFSPKDNASIIPLLQQHFPDTWKEVQKNELKELLRPAILSAKDDMPINVTKLQEIIEKKLSGSKELVDVTLSPETLESVTGAMDLLKAIPSIKDSGTPGGLMKLLDKMPQAGMAALAGAFGHNPVLGYLMGEMTQKLGRDIPDAARVAYLKFLGSNQGVKAEGFKAMTDYVSNVYKGEKAIKSGMEGLFKGTQQSLKDTFAVSEKEISRIKTFVDENGSAPEKMLETLSKGDLSHYMPEQHGAASQSVSRVTQYLSMVKPKPTQLSPLDAEIPPSSEAMAKYDRTVAIAAKPLSVLLNIKDGTLLQSDIQDLKSMYPALYDRMQNEISSNLAEYQAKVKAGGIDKTNMIPYPQKMAISKFLGTPVDTSLKPVWILNAQPKTSGSGGTGQQPAGTFKPPSAASLKSLQKLPNSYLTPDQARSGRRQQR